MPTVWVYNNWKHHVVVRTTSDKIIYNKVKEASSSEGKASIEVGVELLSVGLGGGGAKSKAIELENIVHLDIQKPGYTRIEAGGKMFFPYGHKNKEAYISIWIHKGDLNYFAKMENQVLHPKRDTQFSVRANGAVEPRGKIERLLDQREKYPDHQPTDAMPNPF
eukprot:GFUD01026996.1.p1 GENE.GFUD01026996.1~~GFUD01026996.1.p1  ORF type:complete len:164 (-),score=43.46 GFUD01026996.1:50-541(-)